MSETQSGIRWTVIAAIVLALGIFFAAQSSHPIVPSEDAYISFRYARNMADGQGLVWNAGEDPVEGSTEFLWVLLLAGADRLGLSVEQGAQMLNTLFAVLAIILTGFAAYLLSRKQALVALLAAGALAAGPLAYHARAGFATTLFTLLITVIFLAEVVLVLRRKRDRWTTLAMVALPLASLLLGLTRPEGVLLAAMVIVITLILLPGPERKRLLKYCLLFLFVPGAIYFLWRWQYFGYLLPNTFYVKSSGSILHLRYFFDIYELFRFMAPLFLLIGAGLMLVGNRGGWRILLVLAPVFVFPWSYLLIDQLQNMGQRFQYPVFPIYLLATAAALGVLRPDANPVWSLRTLAAHLAAFAGLVIILFALFVPLERQIFIAILAAGIILIKLIEKAGSYRIDQLLLKGASLILLTAFTVFFIQHSYRLTQSSLFYPTSFDDRQTIGAALQPYAGEGYTIVASEAGWLPFFSQWRAIDPFGLNDETITHQGLTPEYLHSTQPDIIMYHDVKNPHPPRWTVMVDQLQAYAENNNFILAAVIERKGPEDLHVYYVRADNPDASALIDLIINQDFIYSYKYPAAE